MLLLRMEIRWRLRGEHILCGCIWREISNRVSSTLHLRLIGLLVHVLVHFRWLGGLYWLVALRVLVNLLRSVLLARCKLIFSVNERIDGNFLPA